MKKLLMMMVCCVAMVGCGSSGVTQEQYESVVAERDEYKARLESIAEVFDSFDDSTTEKNVETTEATKEDISLEKIVLLDSGWCSYKSGDWAHVPYAVQIQNPNSDYAVEFPTITITAKDADGKILSTDEQVLNSIAADDTIIYGNDIFYEGDVPSIVDISVSNKERNFKTQDDDEYVKQSDFVVSNISENDGMFKKYTGEISNNSEVDFDTVAVIVIYKSGDSIIGGEVTYVDDLMANSTKPFELSSDSDKIEYDSYEFYAIQW